ncbi:MAG: hypothetical protein KIT80_19250 [Chitinophagaceae bacterium]|nr:hypothetical protein [Chitinophagaceae bacterium]MCW5929065.1 hypothetical protein [Chitinophagaceae bacterium]
MKKRLSILAAGLCYTLILQAQENTVPDTNLYTFHRIMVAFGENPGFQPEANAFIYDEKTYRGFKRMRTTGIVFAGVGVGLLTAGVAWTSGLTEEQYEGYLGESAHIFLRRVLFFGIGGLATTGGITLLIIGNKKMKQYGETIKLQQAGNRLGLVYAF